MKSDIQKIFNISQKEQKNIIGLMSGTSLDGLDVAFCEISGHGRNSKVNLLHFQTVPYPKVFKDEVRKIFSVRSGDIELLTVLHAYIGKYHGSLINQCLRQWNIDKTDVDLIASHGQTVYHAPMHVHQYKNYGNATLQIGDGDHLAVETGILTVSDFRLKHIAAGGEGAPLALYGDYLIFSDELENRILLNIGGISNFTWLPNAQNSVDHPCFSTDVGPGNTIMDVFVQQKFNLQYDENGAIAKSGVVNQDLLSALLQNDFLALPYPKTIGPELFNLEYVEKKYTNLNLNLRDEDVLATLNTFTASVISSSLKNYIPKFEEAVLFVSGGGMYNQTLMETLEIMVKKKISSTASLNVHPDAKEAILFALLANECISGQPLKIHGKTKGFPEITMGKISLPN